MPGSAYSLTVHDSILQKDVLLHVVAQLAVEFAACQIHVLPTASASSSNHPTPLQLDVGSDEHDGDNRGTILVQRNAILRTLVRGALDHKPFYLAGSYYAHAGRSPLAAMNRASLSAWMSVADQLRLTPASGAVEAITPLMDRLDMYLATHAFLIDSPVPTVADMDLVLAIVQHSAQSSPLLQMRPNTRRWMQTTLTVLQQYATRMNVPIAVSTLDGQVPGEAHPLRVMPPPTWWFAKGGEDPQQFVQSLQVGGVAKTTALANPSTKGSSTTTVKEHSTAPPTKANPEPPSEVTGTKNTTEVKSKKKASAAATGAAGAANTADSKDDEDTIMALDIRVGEIVKIWPHPEADKLFCEEIDLGNGEIRQIASGLRAFYKEEDLLHKKVLVLCNLKKRNLVGFPSHGMVLCASNSDHTAVEIVIPSPDTPLGERVLFEGLVTTGSAMTEPAPENKVAKKKLFEKLAPDLRTNADGIVIWKGSQAYTQQGGVIRAVHNMPDASVS